MMLQRLNPWIKGKKARRRPAQEGQVAVILIIIIAVALIFLAVSLNLGKIARNKMMTVVASNVSAGYMGSLMASYAESLYQVYLGGEEEADDDLTTNKVQSLATIIVSIFAIILSAIIPGGVPLLVTVVGLSLNVVAGFLQVAVVQPEVDKLLAKMVASIQAPADRFVEQGVFTAMRNIVTDQATVPDDWDLDMDGIFAERAGRFEDFYIRQRMQKATPFVADPQKVANFLQAIGEFVYEPYWDLSNWQNPFPGAGDNWALWDNFDCRENSSHICCKRPPLSRCFAVDCAVDPTNPCCPPAAVCNTFICDPTDPNSLHPECCQDPADIPLAYAECNPLCRDAWQTCPMDPVVQSKCQTGCSDGRCRVYDPYFDNDRNTASGVFYFKEWLGRDDDNLKCTGYYADADDPIGNPAVSADLYDYTKGIFRHTDATGLFSSLWHLGPMMQTMGFVETDITADNHLEMCTWCDIDYAPCASVPMTVPRPDLTTCLAGGSTFEDCCINAADGLDVLRGGTSSLYFSVSAPEGQSITVEVQPLLWDPFQCAPTCGTGCPPPGPPSDPLFTQGQVWKPGKDGYCSFGTGSPYNIGCPYIHCEGSCRYDNNLGECDGPPDSDDPAAPPPNTCTPYYQCGDTPEENWHYDALDDIRQEMDGFIAWANDILSDDVRYLSRTMPTWYPQFQTWMDVDDEGNQIGILADWKKFFERIKAHLALWRVAEHTGDDLYQCGASGTYTIDQIKACLEGYAATLPDPSPELDKVNYRLQYIRTHIVDDDPANPPYTTYEQLNGVVVGGVVVLKGALTTIIDRINQLYTDTGPIRDEWDNYLNNGLGQVLSNTAIYGWKDDPDKGDKWHIVYTQAKLPTRCDGQCERRPVDNHWIAGFTEPYFPNVYVYRRHMGMEILFSVHDSRDRTTDCDSDGAHNIGGGCGNDKGCREYDNATGCFKGGTVKSRVVRYDEDSDWVALANKFKIWQFMFRRPGTEPMGTAERNVLESTACLPSPNQRAFLLNKRTDNPACWDAAINLLNRGVKTDTCAEYYFNDQAGERGFNARFVPCRGTW